MLRRIHKEANIETSTSRNLPRTKVADPSFLKQNVTATIIYLQLVLSTLPTCHQHDEHRTSLLSEWPQMSRYRYNFACTGQQALEISLSSLIPLQTTQQSLGQRPCSINEVSKLHFHAPSMYHQTVCSSMGIRAKPGNAPVAASAWNNLNPCIHVAPVSHTHTHHTTQDPTGRPSTSFIKDGVLLRKQAMTCVTNLALPSWHLQSLARGVTKCSRYVCLALKNLSL